MSSFDPLLLVQEQALEQNQQRGDILAYKAGAKATEDAQRNSAKLQLLRDLWKKAYAKAGGDREAAESLWKAAASKMRIQDPEAELRILKEAETSEAKAGVFDFIRGGKLPPAQEQAARTGQPWSSSPEMIVDQQMHEAKIGPADRGDRLRDIKQEVKDYQQQHLIGAPSKVGEIWETITRPFTLGGQAVAGAIGGGLNNIRQHQKLYEEEHPWIKDIGGIGPTIGGVDWGQYLLLDKPNVNEQLDAVTSGAGENVETNGRSADVSIPGYLNGVVRDYIKEYGEDAISQAQNELGQKATPPEVQDRAIEIVLNKVPEDDLGRMALEHPYITDFIIQQGGDPLNAAPLVRAALAPVLRSGVNKLGFLGEKVGNVSVPKFLGGAEGKTVGNAFNADYDIDKLIRRGYETAGAQLSVVEPKARYLVQSSISNMREKYLRPISKLVKSDEDKKVLFDALHGDEEALAKVGEDPNLKKAFELHSQLEEEHAALRRETAQGQYWSDEGVLMNPGELQDQHYVPGKLELEPSQAPGSNEWQLVKGSNLNRNKAGSSYHRSEDYDYTKMVPDVVKQWEAEFKDFARPAQGSQQIKQTARISTEAGLMKTVQNDKVDDEIKALTESTGMKWESLPEKVEDIWQQYSGTPLHLKKGTQRTLVPEPMVNQVRMLTTFADPKDPSKFFKLVKDSLGFTNRLFSKSMTIPWLKFHEVQAASNLGLAPIFFGSDVLSNRMLGSIPAAIGGAFKNPTALKRLPLELATGKKGNWFTVVQGMRERGFLSSMLDMDVIAEAGRQTAQGESKLGRVGAAIANAPGQAERGLRKAGEFLKVPEGMSRAAKVSDDQVKLMAFVHFLEDFDPISMDKAAKKAQEFAMNYSKMGWFEKDIISNIIPFYGWSRFIAPRIIKTAIMYPERIAPFIKAYEGEERRYGPNAPYLPEGVPSYVEGRAVTAPYDLQPPDQQTKIAEAILDLYDKKGRPEPGTDEFTMLSFDSGPSMAAPVVTMMFGDDRKQAARMLFPVFNAMLEMASGTATDTGKPLTRFPTNAQQWGASPYGRLVHGYTGRFTDSAKRILKLLENDPVAQANFKLKLQVSNDIGYGLTKLWNAVDDTQLPEVPFGMRANYIESPVKNAEYGKANVLEDIQGFSSSERSGNR